MTSDTEDFAELALRLHEGPTVVETVDRVLEFALKAVNCSHAGVTFIHKGNRVETVAVTDPLVAELDTIQVACGQGPDTDVLDTRISIIVADTRTDEHWPRWAALVDAAGVRSLLSVRLYTSTSTIGRLSLYDVHAGQFDHDDQAVAHVLARHAAVALSTVRTQENLWHAIDARKLIGQAQGILMERFGLDPDKAFSVLLRYSQDKNVKLHLVAERLIATRSLP